MMHSTVGGLGMLLILVVVSIVLLCLVMILLPLLVDWVIYVRSFGTLESCLRYLKQKSSVDARRRAVAKIPLYGSEEPNLVCPALVEALSDDCPWVRASAALSLGRLKYGPAVEKLVHLVVADNAHVSIAAATALNSIGPQGIQALVGVLKAEPAHRRKVVAALRSIKPLMARDDLFSLLSANVAGDVFLSWAASSILLALRLNEGDVEAVSNCRRTLLDWCAGNYRKVICLGKDESIPLLVATMDSEGTVCMGVDFLNCGQPELAGAASSWATRNGYIIERQVGSPAVQWGTRH